MQLDSKKVHIDQLYLDPNNYRFVDADDYEKVDDADATSERVQRHVRQLLQGKGIDNISELVKSFKINGFLDLELIQVRELTANKYLVLEGNRRVATLKYLYERYITGENVGQLTEASFSEVPVKVIKEDLKSHLVAMGLHHISGKKRWNPLNQARLIYDLVNQYNVSEDEACDTLACSKIMLRKSLRALALIQAYEYSDYGDQFRSDMFSIFEEIVKSPTIKFWLGWDDGPMSSQHKEHQELLFSWISRTPAPMSDDEDLIGFGVRASEDEDTEETEGEMLDPIITKSSEIRLLSKFIDDENALERMVEQRSVSEGYAYSEVVNKGKVTNAISQMASNLSAISSNASLLRPEDKNRMRSMADIIRKMLPANQGVDGRIITELLYAADTSQFDEITIERFRGLRNLKISSLKRVNLFVGANNSGKTTLLEAVYLLTQLNDAYKIVETEKLRGRIEGETRVKWLLQNVPEGYNIRGSFNHRPCWVEMKREIEKNADFDKSGYLTTLETIASSGSSGKRYSSIIRIYDDRPQQVIYKEAFVLCRSAITSPYRRDAKLLTSIHGQITERGQMDELMEFIRQHFDDNIQSIDLISVDDLNRFVVKTRDGKTPMELTKYGEGLQRIFEISLYIINSVGGCLLIDEIDSAIHKSLLEEFIDFVTKLAEEYNVQLFITTHSKECVKVFSRLSEKVSLMAYRLEKHNGESTVRKSDGKELHSLITNFDLDIR